MVEVNEAHPEREPGEYVTLSVGDNGSGIPKEHLTKIFDPFFTTKPSGQGTGLGLSTCYGIAAQHKGWIECDSKMGEGTTFTVFIPAMSEDTAANLEGDEQPTEEAPKHKSLTTMNRQNQESLQVLVIDDEDPVRKIARLSLERQGFQVLDAASGKEGLEIFQERPSAIDVVILDRNMPGETGEEVFANLVDVDPQVKVVICSGFSIEVDEFATATGAVPVGSIQKPYSINDLCELVRAVVAEDASVTLAR